MSEALTVEIRQARGKRNARRLRAAGSVPAVLYGHGEENISLAIPGEQLTAMVRHGARVVDLAGAVSEKAFIRDLQWDIYGNRVLHIDLTRVSADEMVRVSVVIELRGAAPGAKEGGVVEQVAHELEIECRAIQIPEKMQVNINDLHLGQSITAGQLPTAEGVRVLTDPETIIVHCVLPRVEADTEGGEGGTAEPEIIGRKPGDEEAEEA